MIRVYLDQSKFVNCKPKLRFDLGEISEPLYFELEKELF